jgi:hypothetical protein
LNPGEYIFKAGLTIDGGASVVVSGNNVVLYGTCPTSPCNGAIPAALRFQGQASLSINGRSYSSGTVNTRIAVWMDRTAGAAARPVCTPSAGTAGTISFSGQLNLSGTHGAIYGAGSTITFSGLNSNPADVAVLADKACISGNANFTGTWVQVPGGTSTSGDIQLVE